MYLKIVSKDVLSIVVKEDQGFRQTTKQVRVPRKAVGLLDLPWGRCQANNFFYKANRTNVGGTFHITE